ncbi:chaperone for protein-folding within the ER, fungal-domain-containing protein [Ganoderma leucocontextum]|nr:chaperone for protein-folding within the ER, fungal-domain-containing protein [Ganoderma leucocontextum]
MFIPTVLAFALAAIPSAFAQDYSAAHNVTPISGTWSSGSKKVITGSGFANPANMTFTYPPVTGVSYAFTDDGYYEVARYRFTSNGSAPNCITGVLNWHHGQYTFNTNGSITLSPFGDGYQQIQDPCAAESNFIEGYNDTELYRSWQIFQDPDDGPKLHLYQSDGTPVAPLFQVYSTANMLPTQSLRNVTVTITDQTSARFVESNSARQWTSGGVTSIVSGAFVVSLASLLL